LLVASRYPQALSGVSSQSEVLPSPSPTLEAARQKLVRDAG
jgi:hypothetical protein